MELSLTDRQEYILGLEPFPTKWLKELFPRYCYHDFAPHQEEFWEWCKTIVPGETTDSFIAIWPRGHGKSTNSELACVYVGATQSRNYVVYVCETQEQANKHVADIGSMLGDLSADYPLLAQRSVNMYGHSKGWRRNRLVTGTGYIIDALGLDTAARGIKFEGHRPDLIIFDDIDSKHDNAGLVKKKIDILTHSIMPAGAPHVVVLGVQNLIHKDSIFSQLADGRAEFLADRKVSGPYPAITGLTYEKRKNGIGYVITGGKATWAGCDIEVCQRYITKFSIKAFLAEHQHDVTQVIAGAIFPEYSELHHIITRSEFKEFYGEIATDYKGQYMIPLRWTLGRGQDWGTTPGHPCATIFAARPDATCEVIGKTPSNEDISGLTDSAFVYREIVRPVWPPVDDKPEPIWPGKIARIIRDAQKAWNEEKRMRISVMSHEASAALNTYLYELPDGEKLHFTKWEPDRNAGIPQLQEYFAIDWSKYHPFRKDPRTGKPIEGCPRLFFIVEDDQGKIYVDKNGSLAVRPAKNAEGLARLRWEIPQYGNRVDATGQELNRVEDKRDDDAIDGLKGMAAYFFPRIAPLTDEEKKEKNLNPSIQLKNIKQLEDPEEQAKAYTARQIHKARIEKSAKPNNAFSWMSKRK